MDTTTGFLLFIKGSLIAFGSLFLHRRPLARLLSTFLCCLAIVIRPVSRLGGKYAFLVLPFQTLIFGVQESLAQQLELTVLNVIGAVYGIGAATLGKYIASLTPEESLRARATCATFLIVISFFAGLVKSRLVRLTVSMRISLFAAIWILTINIGDRSRVLADSGGFLYATIAPASMSLVALLFVMMIGRWSSSSFEKDMAATFGLLQSCLSLALNTIAQKDKHQEVDSKEYTLRNQLFQRSVNLNETYSQAAFELRLGRLSLKSIRPLISIVEHVRRELAWGMSARLTPSPLSASRVSSARSSLRAVRRSHSNIVHAVLPSHTKFLSAIEPPSRALGQAVIEAMKAVEFLVIVAFDQDKGKLLKLTKSTTHSPKSVKYALHVAEHNLVRTRNEAREKLGHVFDEMDLEGRKLGKAVRYPPEVLDGSLTMIALLQMAQEMRTALQIADRMYKQYQDSRVRLWYPHISLSWLGVPPGHFISDDSDTTLQFRTATTHSADWPEGEVDANLITAETAEGLAETGFGRARLPGGLSYAIFSRGPKDYDKQKPRSPVALIAMLWAQPRTIRLRIWLAGVHRVMLRSPHLRHAMKNAVGVAVLSFPAFMPADSSARIWFSDWHGEWMVISYVWVLETNTGATWRCGYLRLVGTVLAAIYAYIVYLIVHRNPYGLTVLVTVADIPFTYLITKTNLGPLAVPAAVTLPIIVFSQYITPDPGTSVLKLAAIRALMIVVGIVAALLVNAILFPRHCRVLFLSDTSHTLHLLAQLYMTLSHEVFRRQSSTTQSDKRKTLKLELQIRNNLFRLSSLITTMQDEISLLPKPLGHYRVVVMVMQNLLDVMTGLRKIRENIPRRETVARVSHERREFMSCVCITLYACQHAFRAREPLPQFLPSTRRALENLEDHVQDSIRKARDEDANAMGLSLVYAFAEQEVMKNMVDSLEELLELTGRVFGTSTWLTHQQHMSMTNIHEAGGDHGWYSTFKWEEV